MHGRAALMGQELEEVGRRALERDLDRAVVDRLDAEVLELRARLALVDLLGVEDRIEDVGIFRAGVRVHDAAEGEDEVGRLHRVAVRPFRVAPEREAVDAAVVGDLVLLGHPRRDLAGAVVDEETFVEVAQDIGLVDRRGLVRIEGLGIGVVAAVVGDLRRCRARERRRRHRGERERPEPAHACLLALIAASLRRGRRFGNAYPPRSCIAAARALVPESCASHAATSRRSSRLMAVMLFGGMACVSTAWMRISRAWRAMSSGVSKRTPFGAIAMPG